MDNKFVIIVIIIVSLILILLFCTPFLSVGLPSFKKKEKKQENHESGEGAAGDRKTCLVCAARLDSGQQISTVAFPPVEGSNDRLMHIRGCTYCLAGKRERICPVCKKNLTDEEVIIARLFERKIRRTHVHVVGCSKCRGPRSGRVS